MPTNFIWYAGTSSNSGLLTTAVTLLSTELASLGSSANVTSGTFGSSQTGQGILADVFVTCGTSLATGPSVGGNLAGWFLTSPDGGTTFERTVANTAQPRAPDFIIPISTNAVTAADTFRASGPVRVPALKFKVLIQNNLGITFSSSATAYSTLVMAPYAVQY